MIDVFIDISDLENVLQRVEQIDVQPLLVDCASVSLASIKRRVFIDGLDSGGGQIGTYSERYMKVRTGNYPETRIKSGKNKGEFRKAKTKEGQAGHFTKGQNKGAPRPRYNRSADTKVIASLTRQMENDMKVIVGERDAFIGFSDEDNYNKSQWVEATYDKEIWSLTDDERQTVDDLVSDFMDAVIG